MPGSRLRFAMRSIGGRFQLVARALATPGSPARACDSAPPSGLSRMPSRIRVGSFGRRAVVVEGVARDLAGARRVEGDVEQLGAVAVAAEHVRGDEARAGVVALVAEDPVELERVADRLMDLQHHLVGARAAGRSCPRGQSGAASSSSACVARRSGASWKPIAAITSSPPWASRVVTEAARLGVAAGARGDAQHRQQDVEALRDLAAGAGDEERARLGSPQRRRPVDDARIALQALALRAQQTDLVGERQLLPRLRDRARVRTAHGLAHQVRRIDHAAPGARRSPRQRLADGAREPTGGEVAGAGVAHAAAGGDRDHHAEIDPGARRLHHPAPHRDVVVALLDDAQRPEVGHGGDVAEAADDVWKGAAYDHPITPED